MSNEDDDPEGDSEIITATKPKTKKPPMYKVMLLNDDYTPMEFVVEVLETYFAKDRSAATQIMLTIHTKGKAACGVYPKDIAETKAVAVNKYARESGHPLLCEVEPNKDVKNNIVEFCYIVGNGITQRY